MHIEIFHASDEWYWHKNNKGRITCDSESFPTKAHAVRAAKADVVQTIKPYDGTVQNHLVFTLEQDTKRAAVFILRWSN